MKLERPELLFMMALAIATELQGYIMCRKQNIKFSLPLWPRYQKVGKGMGKGKIALSTALASPVGKKTRPMKA